MSSTNYSTRLASEIAYGTYILTTESCILTVMLSVFAIVGSIGNSMVLKVFQGLTTKATSRLFIMALAVIDLFTCVAIIPLTIVFELTHHQLYYDFFCKVYHFLITSQIPFSAFIMVAIACDRYLSICHSIMVILTPVCTKITLVCLALLTIILGIIPTLGFGVYQVVSETDEYFLSDIPPDFDLWHFESFNDLLLEEQDFNGTLQSDILCLYFMKNDTNCKQHDYENYLENGSDMIYDKMCRPTEIWLSFKTLYIYQVIHSLLFAACFLMVLVLYGLIYRFMSKRRSDKLKRKLSVCARIRGNSIHLTMIPIDKRNKDDSYERHSSETKPISPSSTTYVSNNMFNRTSSHNSSTKSNLSNEPDKITSPDPSIGTNHIASTRSPSSSFVSLSSKTPLETVSHNSSVKSNSAKQHKTVEYSKYTILPNLSDSSCHYGSNGTNTSKKNVSAKKSSAARLIAETRSANIKTAIMLGVVTVVFFVAFFPAWLMSLGIIPIQIVVFYLYFIHNIANPFVYAFMNPAFRERLGTMVRFWVNRISRAKLHKGNVEPS